MKRTISWLIVLLWMALIFFLSSQPADLSNELSTGITETIARAIERIIPGTEIIIGELNHIVRKNAHFIAYLVSGYDDDCPEKQRSRPKIFLLTMLICVLYRI